MVATDPFLKVTNECKADDCKYSWSRMSAIVIEELHEEIVDLNQESEKLGCGEAYIKGKCDRKGEDVENCLYDLDSPGQNNCYGPYDLVMVDKSYFCKD